MKPQEQHGAEEARMVAWEWQDFEAEGAIGAPLDRDGLVVDRPRPLPFMIDFGQVAGLGVQTWREVMKRFYEEHNPEKIQDIDGILTSFQGREP